MMQGQRGITGPETAIILSAFVIVASVFAFTILPVGNFAAQQSSETADADIEQARGTLNQGGWLVARTGSVSGTTSAVQAAFTLSLAI